MPISDNQLETWAKQGPTGQFTATYETIKTYLSDTRAPYNARSYTLFLQGSYKNDTNVYADSDVDIVMRIDDIYYTDLSNLSEEDRTRYNAALSSANYTLQQFRSHVTAWLAERYGANVDPNHKAVLVKGNDSRRDADVLVCAKLRRYSMFRGWNDQSYIEGICFFLADGTRIDNFPVQHHDNCTTKHQLTNNWFKPTVRVYKNLRNAMVEKRLILDGLAPSYFIEGLIYNVDNAQFGGTRARNFADTLNWLNKTDRSKFVCANEQFYLCHATSPVTWRTEKCTEFLSRAIDYWNNGGVKWT